MTLEDIKRSTEPYRGAAAGTTNEGAAQATINSLKNSYRSGLASDYSFSAGQLANEKAAALREQAIAERQAESALPERLARAGINGGGVASTIASLKAGYQSGRNEIRQNYMTSLAQLGQQYGQRAAEADRSLDQSWLDYLLTKAQAENSAKLKKAYSY